MEARPWRRTMQGDEPGDKSGSHHMHNRSAQSAL